MNGKDIFLGLKYVGEDLIEEAETARFPLPATQKNTHRKIRRPLLIAAVIALTLLLVGCAVAYANDWFQRIFSARSETPLSSEQIQYIQNNEQIVGQSQTINDWTVDLKSTI